MKSLPGSMCLGLLLLAGSSLALPAAADDVTLTGVSSFASIDGSAQDHDGLANGVFTVDDGNLVIDGTVSCNDDPPKPGYANACPMRFAVSGDMTIEAGGVLSAENRIGGGNGGNITLTIGGNLLLRGATPGLPGALVSGSRLTGTHHPAGNLTFTVGGDVALEKGSILDTGTIASQSGAISITAGGGIEVAGLVASGPGRTVLATRLTEKVLAGDNSGQGGGPITLRSASAGGPGIRVEADGIVVSQGEGPGAGTVILEACGVEVRGLVASVSRSNGPTQVLVRSGSEILVDGRDLGAADTTLTRRGRVRADATRRSAQTHGVDLFAQGAIEVHGPATATLFAVSSLPGANNKTIPGGMIRAYSLDGTLTASGKAFETGRPTTGNKGGTIDLRSHGDALLDGATLKAMGGGQGGTIAVRSYQGDISWMFGVGDARLIGTGASAAAQGAVQLTACGTVNVTGTQFPTNGSPIPPFPVITAGVCSPAAPVLPADQAPLPVCDTNGAPVADDQSVTTEEDTPVGITLTGSDPDSDPLTFTVVDNPDHGSLSGTVPNLTYTPDPDFAGSDSFTFTVNDGTTDSAPATVSITLTPADDDAEAVDDEATVNEDAPATTIDVLANDDDPDGGSNSIAAVTQPANGTVVNNGTNLTYQPAPNYCNNPPGTALDTFTYTLSPGGDTATVTVTVNCVDDDPTAVADTATVAEDSLATAIDVLANDTDPDGGTKSISSVTQPANGTVVNNGTNLTYQPAANYCNNPPGTSPDVFSYTLAPGGSSTTVLVLVNCLDDAPAAVADSATVDEDSPATSIDVLANDTDVDGGPKSIGSVTQPAHGAIVITGGGTGLTYQPAPNYCNTPPGTSPDTFTYTLNGGSSATVSVQVTCLNDPPVANPETFEFIGNTELRVDLEAVETPHARETTLTGLGVLHNDSDHPTENDPISVVGIVGCADLTAPFVCPLSGVGTVTMESNGRFSFVPEPGDTGGSESFQYTLSDGQATVNATVTLNRFHRVWYVRNNADAGGLGCSGDPFDTLGEAENASLADDYIFVYAGDGTTTGHSAGIALKNGQHLIGQHVGLSLPVDLNDNGAPTHLVAAAPGSRPVLDDTVAGGAQGVSATDAIPAEIVGLSLGGNVNGIDWTTNAAFAGSGTFTIRDNVIRSAANEGVDINLAGTGALNLAFHDNALAASGTALDIQRTGTGTLTITAFDDNVVGGDSAASGLVVSGARFDAVPGGGVDLVSGGTTVIGASGNAVGGAGLVLGGVTGGLSFTDLDVFADGGAALQVSGGAGGFQLAVNPSVAILEATGGPAVDVSNAAINLPLASLKSTNSASSGVSLATVTGSFSAGSGSSITSNTGRAFQVDSSNAAVSYAGTINNNGTGVSLTNNPGSTIAFTGAMTLSTGASAAFTATGSGTVSVTGSANTLTTTVGTALNVTNTTIGATGLTFRSIAAGTAASGPVNGIVLNNTGASGGLTVAGTGAAGTGGTIERTTGDSILLTNTRSVSLSSMNVQNSLESGILGTSVTGLNLTSCSFTSNGDDSADVGIKVTNLAGNATFSNTSVTGSALANVFIDNTTGTLSSFNVSGGSYGSLGTAFGGNSILLNIRGTAALTTGNISGVTLSNNKPARAITIQAQDTATITDFTVQSSTFTNNGVQASFEQSGSANLTFKLLNNPTMTMTLPAAGTSHAINVASSSTSTGGTIQGRIQGNTIGNAATPSSGSPIGNGIRVFIQGRTQATLLIDSNVIRQVPQARGIDAQFLGPLSIQPLVQSDITVTNNDVNPQDSTGFPSAAIYLAADSQAGSPVRMRSDVRGNTVPAGAAVDSLPTFLIIDEVATSAEAQLVDTAPASSNCTAQLASTNTGSSSAAAGCALIAGPISTSP
jgi:Bacterial Ig domain